MNKTVLISIIVLVVVVFGVLVYKLIPSNQATKETTATTTNLSGLSSILNTSGGQALTTLLGSFI